MRFSSPSSVSVEKGRMCPSPGCSSSREKSIDERWILGGVPVLKRISETPRRERHPLSESAGSIPSGPDGVKTSPTTVTPLRYVPVATTAARHSHLAPSVEMTAETRGVSPSVTSIMEISA